VDEALTMAACNHDIEAFNARPLPFAATVPVSDEAL
jgi:hypothetical protein